MWSLVSISHVSLFDQPCKLQNPRQLEDPEDCQDVLDSSFLLFTTSSHYRLPSSLRFKENLPKLALASGAVVVMMLEGVVDSPSSSMETLQSKYLKSRRPKCNDELFHLNPNPQKCSYVKFRKGKEMNLPHETFLICNPNKLAPT